MTKFRGYKNCIYVYTADYPVMISCLYFELNYLKDVVGRLLDIYARGQYRRRRILIERAPAKACKKFARKYP